MKIKSNDTVLVITGKDKNKSGKVLRVNPKNNKLVVEKLNLRTKHVKKTKTSKGEKIKFEAAMDASNVMILCPHCNKPTRIGYQLKGKTKARICKLCKESVDHQVDSTAIKTTKSKKQS